MNKSFARYCCWPLESGNIETFRKRLMGSKFLFIHSNATKYNFEYPNKEAELK